MIPGAHSGVDPRVKLLYIAWVFVMVGVLTHPGLQGGILLVTITSALWAGLSLLALAKAGRFAIFMAAVSWLLWIVFLAGQGRVLYSISGWSITEPGFFNGASVAARITAILLAFLLVSKTTVARQVITALYRLRVPVPFAMVIGITLRLIPQLQAEHAIILQAQRSRAAEFDRGHLLTRLRRHSAYVIPLILRALKITSDLSLAMDARAFDPYGRRTFSQSLTLGAADRALLAAMCVSCAAAIAARLAGYGGFPEQWMAGGGG